MKQQLIKRILALQGETPEIIELKPREAKA